MRCAILFVFLTALIGGYPTAFAAEQIFRGYNYAAGSFAECQQLAASVAEEFAGRTGHPILGHGCEYRASTETTNLVIRYDAPVPENEVTTHPLRIYYEPAGFFAGPEECAAAKPMQEAIFQEQTGLSPLFSYCTFGKHLRSFPWYHYIATVGETSRPPFRTSFFTNSPSDREVGLINEEIRRNLGQEGVFVQSIAWRPNIAHHKATVMGYHDEPIRLNSKNIVEINGLTECQRASDAVRSDFAAQDTLKYITSLCTSMYSNPSRFTLVVVTLNEEADVGYSGEMFATADECQASIPALAAAIERATGRLPVSVQCGRQPHRSRDPVRAAFIFQPR